MSSTRGWACREYCLHTRSPSGEVARDGSGHRVCWACAQSDPVDVGNRNGGVVERRLVRTRNSRGRRASPTLAQLRDAAYKSGLIVEHESDCGWGWWHKDMRPWHYSKGKPWSERAAIKDGVRAVGARKGGA